MRFFIDKAIFILILFYFCFSLFNYSFVEEDAFIYFRCAENIVGGHGYSFNAGSRIEACSSLTWLYLLILFLKLGCNILVTSKILGTVLGCLSLLLIYTITSCFTRQMPWVILPAFLTSLSIPFLFWNQMGLETALYTVIFLSLILICLKKERFIYWPAISLLLVLTRPEGVFLLLGLLPVFYIYKKRRREIMLSSFLFIILFLAIVLVRLFYFHDFLPSPFYTKIYPGKFSEGLLYVHTFFKDHYMYVFLAPMLYLVWQRWNWEKNRVILLGFTAAYLLWVVLGGSEGIFKPFYRHLVPVIPVIFVYTLTSIGKMCEGYNIIKKACCALILLFALLGVLVPGGYSASFEPASNPVAGNLKGFFKSPGDYVRLILNRARDPVKFNYPEGKVYQQLLLGEFIKSNYSADSLLLYDQMGQTPYQTGVGYLFIDSWGLTDKVIGRYYFHERAAKSGLLKLYERISGSIIARLFPEEPFIQTKDEILDYIFRQDPDVMLVSAITCYLRDYLPHWLIMDSRFKNTYRLKYLIQGTLIFEKEALEKKPLTIPDGLSVVCDINIFDALREDLLLQNWGKMMSDDFWKHRHLFDWLAEHTVLPQEKVRITR